MRALDKKLVRDLKRLWAQGLAVALVLACGVATLILAIGSYRSLDGTRAAYYERHKFANVFATATRAPRTLTAQIKNLPGVLSVEARITENVLLDIPGLAAPASGLLLSIPDHALPRLNRPYLRSGRMPDPDRQNEVLISEAFAKSQRLFNRFPFQWHRQWQENYLFCLRCRPVARIRLRTRPRGTDTG